jgi:hypothetical protein
MEEGIVFMPLERSEARNSDWSMFLVFLLKTVRFTGRSLADLGMWNETDE